MTVQELFKSLDFRAIAETLILKPYKDALLPISEYKENYDIICSISFSGEGGSITFKDNGDSDVTLIEGDRFDNIVGMDVILPDDGLQTKVEAAADILWSSGPFGNVTVEEWGLLEDMILNPEKLSQYEFQAKRINLLIALPYCRDKKIRQELKREMQTPYDLSLSGDATHWLLSERCLYKVKGKRQNRSKRKREYRLKKRYDELIKLNKVNHQLNLLKAKIGDVPEDIEKIILSSSTIESACYKSKSYANTSRVNYIADLLLNPLYDSKKFLTPERKQECICVIYSSLENPCTEVEQRQIIEILESYFGSTSWQLFAPHSNILGTEIEIDITYITH